MIPISKRPVKKKIRAVEHIFTWQYMKVKGGTPGGLYVHANVCMDIQHVNMPLCVQRHQKCNRGGVHFLLGLWNIKVHTHESCRKLQ
jgi:hypothetical protein